MSQLKSPQLKATQTRTLEWLPQLDLVFIGLLAILVLQLFRIPTSRWLPALWLESAFFVSVPPLVLLAVSKRFARSQDQDSVPSDWLQFGALAFAGMTFLIQFITRQFGIGDPTEIVAMQALQFGAWYLIIFSGLVPRYKKVGLSLIHI